jgi:hypothetical protein
VIVANARKDYTELQWPDPEAGPWFVGVHWRDVDGRPECIGMNLWRGVGVGGEEIPGRTASPITATALRELKPNALIEAARQRYSQSLQGAVDDLHRYIGKQMSAAGRGKTKKSPFASGGGQQPENSALGAPETRELRSQVRRIKGARQWPKGSSRRGRPPGVAWGPDHWERVAKLYNEAWERREPPTVAVEIGMPCATSTAVQWVHRCRKMGLLPETEQGKARGGSVRPTPKTARKS